MGHVQTYHRPTSSTAAVALLQRADTPTRVLGGGTQVNADPTALSTDLVDLQSLGLTGIQRRGDRIIIGAMTTLQEVADSVLIPDLLRDLARRELPSTLRTIATVGGTVASNEFDSELVAGLLVFDLATTWVEGVYISEISVDPTGSTAAERTGRTPGDRPIVAAFARRRPSGEVVLALSGVAATAIVVDPANLAALDPPGDFRGSSAYRRHVATVLANRVMGRV